LLCFEVTNDDFVAHGPSSSKEKMDQVLPLEMWLKVAEFLQVPDINNLAQTQLVMVDYLFCRNLKNEQTVTQVMRRWFVNTETDQEQDQYKGVQTVLWKQRLLYYFPMFNENLNVKNWLVVLKRRLTFVINNPNQKKGLRKKRVDFDHFKETGEISFIEIYQLGEELGDNFIDNCEWIYKCPVYFDELKREDGYCSVCKERVYQVRSISNFKYHTDAGHCVSFTHRGEKKRGCIIY